MDIAIGLPSGPRQREFLDYLNAALRERMGSYGGSSGFTDDGKFETAVSGKTKFEASELDLTWRITFLADGTLEKVSVFADQIGESSRDWEISAHAFVTSVLSSVLSEKKQKFFKRNFFFYIGEQLDGEYWLPGFRFAPAYPEDPQPLFMNAERIISIDQEVEAIDEMHAFSIAEENARRHASRLSLILNIALYQNDNAHRWVIPDFDNKDELRSERLQLGFINDEIKLDVMPSKSAVCELGKYEGEIRANYRYMGKLISLPKETRRILKAVDNAHVSIKEAFDRGARLNQVSLQCGRLFPSVGLAYRVATIEAICKTENSKSNFSGFMREHVGSSDRIEKLLEYLYGSVRSAHFHGGEFPTGEFSRHYHFDAFSDVNDFDRDSMHRECFQLTRRAIVSWMLSLIANDEVAA